MSQDTWYNYQVPELAQILSTGFDPAYERVLGWQRVGETLMAAADALAVAARQLAEAWPPVIGSASSAFMDEVDALRADILATADDSMANSVWMGCVVASFEQSRDEIVALRSEWVAISSQEETAFVSGAEDWQAYANDRAHALLHASDRAAFDTFSALRVPVERVKTDASMDGSSLMSDVLRWFELQESFSDRVDGPLAQGESSKRLRGEKNQLIIPRSPDGSESVDADHPKVSHKPVGLVLGQPAVLPRGSSNRTDPRGNGREPQVPSRVDSSEFIERRGGPDSASRNTPKPFDDMAQMIPPISSPLGRPRSSRSRYGRQGRDVEMWNTGEGVPPVLYPVNVDQQRHDPGPNVLGIDL